MNISQLKSFSAPWMKCLYSTLMPERALILGVSGEEKAWFTFSDIFRAFLISIFIFTMEQINVCKVKGGICGDKSWEHYRWTLSALFASFISLFLFNSQQLDFWFILTAPISASLFSATAGNRKWYNMIYNNKWPAEGTDTSLTS